jgi:hypothetical protein
MFRCLTAVVVLLGIAGPARGTVDIWLSASGTVPPGSSFPTTTEDIPVLTPYIGGSESIYIWGRPDSGFSLENISLNLVAETPGVIAFTSATMFNPTFSGPATRFEYVDSPPASPNLIEGIEGLTIFNEGSLAAVGIGSSAEAGTGYYFLDGADPSWLIASVTYDVLSTGEGTETELFLEIGPLGMNHDGYDTNDHSVIFGHAMDTPIIDVCVPDREGCNNIYRGFHTGYYYDALVIPRVLPGDADRNGAVEQADFDVWRVSFGSTTLLAADHNGNGTVDAADYVIWRKYLGQSAGSGGAIGVPEPSAAAAAFIALTALLAVRRLSCGRARS